MNAARKLPLPALPARSRACPQRPSSGGLGDTRNRTRGAVTRRWRAIKLIFTRQVSSKSERSNDDSTPSDFCGCTLRDYWPGPESGHKLEPIRSNRADCTFFELTLTSQITLILLEKRVVAQTAVLRPPLRMYPPGLLPEPSARHFLVRKSLNEP